MDTHFAAPLRFAIRISTACVLAVSALIFAGCVDVARTGPSEAMQLEARPVGFPDSVRAMGVAPLTVGSDLKGVTPWIREAAIKEPVNVLALSGGGAGGAFGAGALVGWTRAGTRPEFQVVTGVSVGALVAPFAFLGSAWDDKLREAFSGGRTEHLLRRRWSGALFGSSLYRGQPLASLVDSFMTIEMVRAIGVEAAKGRLLLVATTKLDTEQTVVWNLTAIAAQGTEAARELIRDVLIAAASVPGAFPPVMIHVESLGQRFDEIHVDGAATTTLLTGTEIPGFLPRSVDALLGARLYILVNEQLGAVAQATPGTTIGIIKRGLAAEFRSSARADLAIAFLAAESEGMTVMASDIPTDYPDFGSLDLDRTTMSRLFDFAAHCGASGQLWSTPLEIQERAAQTHIRSTGDESQCPSQNMRWNSRPGQIAQEVGEGTGSELQRLDAAN